MKCSACSGSLRLSTDPWMKRHRVYVCSRCGGVQGRMYLGDSFMVVRPAFAPAEVAQEAEQEGRARYFDFETVGSGGLGRRHGWYDPKTRLILQVG